MKETFSGMPLGNVKLAPGMFRQRFELNRKYLFSLRSEQLLQNYYLEAGLTRKIFRATAQGDPDTGDDWLWGWESPTCQVRGHFLGHWLSAAARIYASTADAELKGRADYIVAELARCQAENGGEWAGSIPEKYLDWVARGKQVWAPQYTLHKTLMGLVDMVKYAENDQALDVLERFASWFHRWSGQFTREEMDDILDVETGGMLEVWADLYGLTGKQEHLDLMHRYDRPRLFDRLLAGEDALTNRHANTTVPEAHGAARAYEVTGDERWRRVAEAYWRFAVTERGTFCTGGQTSGEVWTPPFEFAARLGATTQEHCVVYNMMRLADYLLRWTGDVKYADYIERNLYNGILAQQNASTGMVAYFLPLEPGGRKVWGSPTNDFWCCHGTLVQAHTTHNAYVYYQDAEGLAVSQYIPTDLSWEWQGVPVSVSQRFDTESCTHHPLPPDGASHRPERWVIELKIACKQPTEFVLKLRLPWWLKGEPSVSLNGESQVVSGRASSYCTVRHRWQDDVIRLVLPKGLQACPLPDDPERVAFMDGPVVLAGLCDEDRVLHGDASEPEKLLVPDNEREWEMWRHGYRVQGQERGLRFLPLHEIQDQRYSVYFRVEKP